MGEDFYELVGLGKGGAQDGGLERWKWYNESLSFIDGSCFLDESGFHFLTMSGFFFSVFICCLLKPSFLAVPSIFNPPIACFYYQYGAHVTILLTSKDQYSTAFYVQIRRQKTCLGHDMNILFSDGQWHLFCSIDSARGRTQFNGIKCGMLKRSIVLLTCLYVVCNCTRNIQDDDMSSISLSSSRTKRITASTRIVSIAT